MLPPQLQRVVELQPEQPEQLEQLELRVDLPGHLVELELPVLELQPEPPVLEPGEQPQPPVQQLPTPQQQQLDKWY
jgi:hypothetical protein